MTPSEFLRLLWGDVPPGQALVWRLPSKQSTWFRSWDNVDKFCAVHAKEDIYTGVSLMSRETIPGANFRTSNTNAAAIAGLWADIDVAGPVHKKANLPEEPEQATALLDPFPTLVIHSGHGLQCWWLFDKPWVFADAAQRISAQRLAQWWHRGLVAQFARRGWTLDATHDLARVLRIPGTINHKGMPVPVTVWEESGKRLELASLQAIVPPATQDAHFATQTPRPAVEPLIGEISLSPDAMPPLALFEALAAASEKFMRSWLHQRPDMLDQSASAYDMSLASIAVQAEWRDQQIADLLIAHRRERGEGLKLREDYYRRTILKARAAE